MQACSQAQRNIQCRRLVSLMMHFSPQSCTTKTSQLSLLLEVHELWGWCTNFGAGARLPLTMLLPLLPLLVESSPGSKCKAFSEVSFVRRKPEHLHARCPYRDSTGVTVWLIHISAQLGALAALLKGH